LIIVVQDADVSVVCFNFDIRVDIPYSINKSHLLVMVQVLVPAIVPFRRETCSESVSQ